jgi:caffeic acid 3-O-methyltransferase
MVMTLKAAIQLGLIDALTAAADGRALTAGELVAQLPAVDDAEAATSVDRMLRLLASFNVVRCSTEAGPGGDPLRRYSPAPVCRCSPPATTTKGLWHPGSCSTSTKTI